MDARELDALDKALSSPASLGAIELEKTGLRTAAVSFAVALEIRYLCLDGSLRGSKGNTVQAEGPMPWLPPQL